MTKDDRAITKRTRLVQLTHRWMLGVCLIALAACDLLPHDPDGTTPLVGTRWELLRIQTPDGVRLDASVLDEPSYLVFSDEAAEQDSMASVMEGSTGCNQFRGNYTLESTRRIALTIGAITLRLCTESVGVFEMAWLAHLETVNEYEQERDRLTLHFERGSFTFRAKNLAE